MSSELVAESSVPVITAATVEAGKEEADDRRPTR